MLETLESLILGHDDEPELGCLEEEEKLFRQERFKIGKSEMHLIRDPNSS